jgi:hypothetical protein
MTQDGKDDQIELIQFEPSWWPFKPIGKQFPRHFISTPTTQQHQWRDWTTPLFKDESRSKNMNPDRKREKADILKWGKGNDRAKINQNNCRALQRWTWGGALGASDFQGEKGCDITEMPQMQITHYNLWLLICTDKSSSWVDSQMIMQLDKMKSYLSIACTGLVGVCSPVHE